MPGNSIGSLFRVTTFGESHGSLLGAVIDGCPAGLNLDLDRIQKDLDRRRPGQSHISTQRRESDTIEIVSGCFEGKTTGTPLTLILRNEDQRPGDYSHLEDAWRPSHADYTYEQKYGIRDHRGGGRSSARETALRVAAGAVAKQFLALSGMDIRAFVTKIGPVEARGTSAAFDYSVSESNAVRCPDPAAAEKMIRHIEQIKKDGDTAGGVITCIIRNCPAGLGEPVFDKLEADLGRAVLSIPACKGFEIGSGFAGAAMKGSEHNDRFIKAGGKTVTETNHSGGIQGGISNGMDIIFRTAFKPVSTIMKDQKSVNRKGEEVTLEGKGRHDPCVVPRAVPVVEAMAAIVMTDHLLRNRTVKAGVRS